MTKQSSRRRKTNDITIAGLPIGGLNRITPETLAAFKKARIIFDLTSHLPLLRKYCQKVVNLDKEYWTGELDEDVYDRIANLVLDEAKNGPRVVLVVDGHPGIYQDLSWDIYDRGRRRGLRVRILPALSFLDLMIAFCDLRIDASGLQILDATSVVAYNYPLVPYVDMLLMQIGWFGTSLLVDIEQNMKGRFEPLVKYLSRYYPADHRVKLIRAPTSADERPTIITTKLSTLDRFHRSITTDMTLLVPAVGTDREAANEDFVRHTAELAHLSRIAKL